MVEDVVTFVIYMEEISRHLVLKLPNLVGELM